MRYKVKVTNPHLFRTIENVLEHNVTIYTSSEKRSFFSTSKLPNNIKSIVVSYGAVVTLEQQYTIEGARPSELKSVKSWNKPHNCISRNGHAQQNKLSTRPLRNTCLTIGKKRSHHASSLADLGSVPK